MPNLEIFPLIIRWLHILAACLAIGVPLFMRFVLLPAMNRALDPETAAKLRGNINAIWRRVVYTLITVLILTGVYTLVYIVGKTPLGPYSMAYHAIFGLKMMLALVVFFIASVLPGRMAAFEFMRQNVKMWLTVLVLLVLAILLLANGLRTLRDEALAYQMNRMTLGPGATATTLPATMPARPR